LKGELNKNFARGALWDLDKKNRCHMKQT